MVVLRPYITPTIGTPSKITAQRRPRSMAEREFYEQENRPKVHVNDAYEVAAKQQNMPQFVQNPVTGDYIKEQLLRVNEKSAPPELNPSARVKNSDKSLVQPDNFQDFYTQLGIIDNIGEQQLGAEQARSAFKRLAEMQRIAALNPPGFAGAVLQGGSGGNRLGGIAAGIGGNAQGSVPSNPRANFRFAQQIAPKYGWGPGEQAAWYTLGMKESGWNNNAQNPTSTAYGIGQFLNSTWGNYGFRKSSDPAYQVNAMAAYIKARYGSPSRALAFHRANNWY